uniref:Uncharacterized protein n=1 Tax=Romanomermis culicivorax TaxID=13658 RepID=A0A915KMH0_ROMCU
MGFLLLTVRPLSPTVNDSVGISSATAPDIESNLEVIKFWDFVAKIACPKIGDCRRLSPIKSLESATVGDLPTIPKEMGTVATFTYE